ncbi:hypothetical protein J1605_015283 [Eschrichtius robustus]|uniref:Uncharacterized protein n=1 Tax=Eschrichtius robustus TaxID=9764 RepID=A0AB34GB56_ESCRO|nr:hypothetical protein J1605_015283 [Eschrichtius robustus]
MQARSGRMNLPSIYLQMEDVTVVLYALGSSGAIGCLISVTSEVFGIRCLLSWLFPSHGLRCIQSHWPRGRSCTGVFIKSVGLSTALEFNHLNQKSAEPERECGLTSEAFWAEYDVIPLTWTVLVGSAQAAPKSSSALVVSLYRLIEVFSVINPIFPLVGHFRMLRPVVVVEERCRRAGSDIQIQELSKVKAFSVHSQGCGKGSHRPPTVEISVPPPVLQECSLWFPSATLSPAAQMDTSGPTVTISCLLQSSSK